MMHVTTYLKGLLRPPNFFMQFSRHVDVHWLTCVCQSVILQNQVDSLGAHESLSFYWWSDLESKDRRVQGLKTNAS